MSSVVVAVLRECFFEFELSSLNWLNEEPKVVDEIDEIDDEIHLEIHHK